MAAAIPPGTDLCTLPAGIPPLGTIPNLVDPPSLKTSIIAISALMLTWAISFTITRLWHNPRKVGWADYFCVIAVTLSCGYTATCLGLIKWSRHQWDTPLCWFDASFMKWLYAQGVLLGPTIFFAKASIFFMYLQIFSIQKLMRYAIHGGVLFTFLTYWVHVPLESYFAAPHVGERWEDLLLNQRPNKLLRWAIVQGTLAVVIDIYIFVLPIRTIASLQLSFQKKIQVLGVFLTASMGIVASVIALVYRVKLLHSKDITWDQSSLFICVIVENNVAIIVSCMPAFAAFTKVTVGESAFYKSWQSRLSGTTKNSSTAVSSKRSTSQQKLHTDYSSDTASRGAQHPYVELDDWGVEEGNIPGGQRGNHITKSIHIQQASHGNSPV